MHAWTAAALRILPPQQPPANSAPEGTFLKQLHNLQSYEDEQIKKGIEMLKISVARRTNTSQRFMYLQPPHTATVTTQLALLSATGQNVIHTHTTLMERIKLEGGWQEFDKKFSFIFVRSPWERVLTCAAWVSVIDGGKTNQNLSKEKEIQKFRTFVRSLPQNNKCSYLQHQHQYVYAKRPNETESQSQLTFIGHTRNLQHDFNKVCTFLGVPKIDINSIKQHCVSSCSEAGHRVVEKAQVTRHRDFREYFDNETAEIVANMWQQDITTFGFQFRD